MSVKLDVVIVVGSIAREKVAFTTAPVATPVAPDAGDVDVTVGADGAAVVKLQLYGLPSGVPSEALIVAARLAVYEVEKSSAEVGVSEAVFVAES